MEGISSTGLHVDQHWSQFNTWKQSSTAKRKSLASGNVDAGAESCVMIVLWSFLVLVIDVSTEWKAIVDNETHKVFRDL